MTEPVIDPGNESRTLRLRLDIRGRVQGVGFRPWIYRLAAQLGLAGFVGNDPRGAFIELEGPPKTIEQFKARLRGEAPPLVAIADITATEIKPLGARDFRILASSHAGEQKAEITPDTATCPDCLREMLDPADRRHRYPFINCTNCGPRYSIIRGVPYDRILTSMAAFVMCPDCQAEYDDPTNRRFHAQPNACPVCGPRIWLADRHGTRQPGDAISETVRRLQEGQILAIKGLGGFHLACRADRSEAVAELRRRKSREAKPLALMVASLEEARRIAILDSPAEAILTSPARPIVLAPQREMTGISPQVAPGCSTFGVMLPYTPLHALLFAAETEQGCLGPLVMTSGNPSAEPLCCDNEEALQRLAGIADAFLFHDRDIERRVDDSVVMSIALHLTPLRRARGYAPAPILLTKAAPLAILAVGGELKSTVCLLSGRDAVLSEHLGDLDNPAAYRNFVGTIARFKTLLNIEPEHVAYDLHPDYAATRYARDLPLPGTAVQHHHAHMAACMADNGLEGEVVGVACDGTGYGTDGTIWGCEILVGDAAEFRRAGHLRTFPLLGGNLAAIETWRPAAGLLSETFGDAWRDAARTPLARVESAALDLAERMLAPPRAPRVRTSSLGRLFDAFAFLLGLCEENHAEAQAAMALEASASREKPVEALEWTVAKNEDGTLIMDPCPMLEDCLERQRKGQPPGRLARAFHEGLAQMLAAGASEVAGASGLDRIVLSGGCFANRLLVERLWGLLREREMKVYIHERCPAGDGGLALGQAVCAAARLERNLLS